MATKAPSLGSKQRANLLGEYRGRGQRNSNLWLVYSEKIKSDLILTSDRHFVHWIYCLEVNPSVATFEYSPQENKSVNREVAHPRNITALVTTIDNRIEWHQVGTIKKENGLSQSDIIVAAKRSGAEYKLFSDKDFIPYVQISIRWLKVIGYAAAIRDQENIHETLLVSSLLTSNESGTVSDIVNELHHVEASKLIGIFARLTINGHIEIDLNSRSFGYHTSWRIRKGE